MLNIIQQNAQNKGWSWETRLPFCSKHQYQPPLRPLQVGGTPQCACGSPPLQRRWSQTREGENLRKDSLPQLRTRRRRSESRLRLRSPCDRESFRPRQSASFWAARCVGFGRDWTNNCPAAARERLQCEHLRRAVPLPKWVRETPNNFDSGSCLLDAYQSRSQRTDI